MRARRTQGVSSRTVVAFVVMGALTGALAAPAVASAQGADPYAWRSCSYAYLEAEGKSILVSDTNDPVRGFPDVTWTDGFKNSFTARIEDAVQHWDHVMTDLVGLDAGMTYIGTGRPAHVRVVYDAVDDANATTTRTYRAGGRCDIHGEGSNEIRLTTITINRRADWFTQGAARRRHWERCPRRSQGASACTGKRDFGSTITHELGHALGLHHPEEVDGLHSTDAAGIAKCADRTSLATMCAVSYTHATAKRTLDAYDVEALRRHYDHARAGR